MPYQRKQKDERDNKIQRGVSTCHTIKIGLRKGRSLLVVLKEAQSNKSVHPHSGHPPIPDIPDSDP
jgi:hypothetical protein